ncbi:hypothetical protein ACFUOZ_07795 [Paenarthrobacter sp. NPDC057355]|uniref:hypothetical protein n=1 Tax=Paenarthrobacter sp. NPDC057355 TaxID=3346105 RepID=UPI003638C20C
MSHNESSELRRLVAADPARAVTEEDLAKSREKSLTVMSSDAVLLTVGGSSEDRPVARRRGRVVAGVGLVAAAAAVVAGVFASSLWSQQAQRPIPAATQPDHAPDTSSPSDQPLPELTGRMPTFDAEIVTGGNGNKAAVAKDEPADFHMDAGNRGTLGLNGGGCIASVYPDGRFGGLIFPRGTKVTESGVVLPDGKSISIGQQFSFGGGLSPEGTDVGECSPGGSPFLVQNWDELPSK